MRVVITAQAPTLSSPTDPRFGRARYLICVDTETGEYSAIDNDLNLNATQGAGIQTGRKVIELQAQALITGYVGPKALATLNAGRVPVYAGSSGTVSEVLEQFKVGKLPCATSADVDGHWA